MFSNKNSSDWKIYTTQNKYISQYIGTEVDEEWKDDFYFVQGADPQFGLHDEHENPNYNPEKPDWTFEIKLAKLAVEKVNKMNPKPRFFVICGDLTNEYPNITIYSEDTKNRQIEDFKKLFSQIRSDIPLICVCGNHDVGYTPTVDSVNKYRSHFGSDFFSFWCAGVLFLVLNSQYYMDPKYVLNYATEQEEWLDRQLEIAKGKRIICFSHIPWFVEDLEEDDSLYNVPKKHRKRILEKLHRAGVRYVFCGHLHHNGGGFYKDLEMIITSAIGMQLASDLSGFRVVKVSKDKVYHRYIELEDDHDENNISLQEKQE